MRNSTFTGNIADVASAGVVNVAEFATARFEGNGNNFTGNVCGAHGGVLASSTNTNITVEGGWFEGNKAGEVGGECEDGVRVTALRPETANASTLELREASPETTHFLLVAARIDEGYRALPVLALLSQLERSRAITCCFKVLDSDKYKLARPCGLSCEGCSAFDSPMTCVSGVTENTTRKPYSPRFYMNYYQHYKYVYRPP